MKDEPKLKIIKLKRSILGKWYFSINGANGEKIAHSQSYWSKSNAKRAANSIIRSGSVGLITLEE